MSSYDEGKPGKYLMYVNANDLNGWAMSQCLPTGGFKWLAQKQIDKLKIQTLLPDRKKGMILEVDLEYPEELYDLHNDYPVAAEKMKVIPDMLSPYYKIFRRSLVPASGKSVSSYKHWLIRSTTYYTKGIYNCMSLGLKLKKVHRVLEFNQSPWLAQYIDYNTKKQMAAKNSFEKDFLMKKIDEQQCVWQNDGESVETG